MNPCKEGFFSRLVPVSRLIKRTSRQFCSLAERMKFTGTLIAVFFCLAVHAQEHSGAFRGWVQYKEDLQNRLFLRTDSVKDSVWIKGGLNQFYNQPINANCITSGDLPPGDKDSLIFCDCLKRHDTLLVQLSTPSACCYTVLNVFVLYDRFGMSAEYSYDVIPQVVRLNAQKEVLALRSASLNRGDRVEGYLYFAGRGKYTAPPDSAFLNAADKNKIFQGTVSGYFKCRIH